MSTRTNINTDASIADLKARTNPVGMVNVLGYYAVNDGGGGLFRWNSASTAADNGGTVIQPSSAPATGRWERVYSGAVDVRWFGAKGDGSTNDTTAITAAKAAAGAGGMVSFSPGTYIASPFALDVASQRWTIGYGATVKQTASTTGSLIGIYASNVSVFGPGTIDVNKANGTTNAAGVYIDSGLSDITVERVTIKNAPAAGIQCKFQSAAVTTRVKIVNNDISNIDGHGVFFNWETTNSQIIGNYIHDSSNVNANGIWVGNTSTDVRIEDNHIQNVGRIGIEVWGACQRAMVLGNRIISPASMGISVANTSHFSRIANNHVESSGYIGIELANVRYAAATANTVITPAYEAFSVDGEDGCIVSDNVVSAPVTYGVQVVKGGSGTKYPNYTIIRGNTFVDVGDRAIFLNDQSDKTIISDNIIRNSLGYDIFVQNSKLCSIRGNIVDATGVTGAASQRFLHINEPAGGARATLVGNSFIGDKGTFWSTGSSGKTVSGLNQHINSSDALQILAGGPGKIMRVPLDPASQSYAAGRNILPSGTFDTWGYATGIIPVVWTLPAKVGNVEPGIVFVFQDGGELERRNSTASPITETWDAMGTAVSSSYWGWASIAKVLYIGNNVAAVAETQDLGAFNFLAVNV